MDNSMVESKIPWTIMSMLPLQWRKTQIKNTLCFDSKFGKIPFPKNVNEIVKWRLKITSVICA